MSNPYYTASGAPATGSGGYSATIRAEFTSIAAGFALLPATLPTNKAVVINTGGTALTTTTGSLALAGDLVTTGAFATTFAASAVTTLTLPSASDTLVGRATTDTLINKTLTSPTITGTLTAAIANFSGTVSPAALLDISNAAAGQIRFPASQNASSNANTLDDYKEGTFTLADASGASITLTNTLMKYTKIGNVCTISGQVAYAGNSDGSNASASGLPFANAGATIPVMTATNAGAVCGEISNGSSTILWIVPTTTNQVLNSTLGGKAMFINCSYFTA